MGKKINFELLSIKVYHPLGNVSYVVQTIKKDKNGTILTCILPPNELPIKEGSELYCVFEFNSEEKGIEEVNRIGYVKESNKEIVKLFIPNAKHM